MGGDHEGERIYSRYSLDSYFRQRDIIHATAESQWKHKQGKVVIMTKEPQSAPKLIVLGSARRQTKGTPIGARQESLMVGYYD